MKNYAASKKDNVQSPNPQISKSPNPPEEPIYVISVVAKMVEMHPQTIRHYERIGFVKPSRTQGKMRLYSRRDVESLTRIAHFTRDMGVNLAGVEVILKLLEEMDEMRRRMEDEMTEFRRRFSR